MIEGINKDQNR